MILPPSPSQPELQQISDSGLNLVEVTELMQAHFPQVGSGGKLILIDHVARNAARVRLPESDDHLRPGGTISVPAMVLLAESAFTSPSWRRSVARRCRR